MRIACGHVQKVGFGETGRPAIRVSRVKESGQLDATGRH